MWSPMQAACADMSAAIQDISAHCQLLPREKEKLVYDFIELSQHSDRDYIPSWLEITCEKMKHPQNFIADTERPPQTIAKAFI